MSTITRAGKVAVSTIIVVALMAWTIVTFGPFGPAPAFLLVWLTVCWFALVGDPLGIRMPEEYHRLRPFEREGRLYRHLGVELFRRLVRRGPLSVLSRSMRLPADPDPEVLVALAGRMRRAEAAHAYAFGVSMMMAAGFLVARSWGTALWATLFNVMVNLYPVLLQRYNRARLEHLSARAPTGTGRLDRASDRP